jgi:hypothetical protein
MQLLKIGISSTTVSDDDGLTKWVAMVKTTKSNYEKTTLMVGEHKFNELIHLNLF